MIHKTVGHTMHRINRYCRRSSEGIFFLELDPLVRFFFKLMEFERVEGMRSEVWSRRGVRG